MGCCDWAGIRKSQGTIRVPEMSTLGYISDKLKLGILVIRHKFRQGVLKFFSSLIIYNPLWSWTGNTFPFFFTEEFHLCCILLQLLPDNTKLYFLHAESSVIHIEYTLTSLRCLRPSKCNFIDISQISSFTEPPHYMQIPIYRSQWKGTDNYTCRVFVTKQQ